MRKQFIKSVEKILHQNEKTVLLLGDIGVFGFRNAFEKFPNRVYNIGILESSTIGLAAGLSSMGLIPIVHTIAPFLVERCYEQLKNDFSYQRLGGTFVSVGASHDYAALGCTHHCPADIGILKNIPNMEIILPGTSEEFDSLIKQTYNNGNPTYIRLSEKQNNISNKVKIGRATVIKKGSKATVIAVGTMLKNVIEACIDLNVTILYYTTLSPFDKNTLRKYTTSNKILLCEPYYSGALMKDILDSFLGSKIIVNSVGIPCMFLEKYGSSDEHEKFLKLTPKNIRNSLKKLINE